MKSNFLNDIEKVSKKAIDELQALSRTILSKLRPPHGPYAIFHHHSHLICRIRDIALILKRMHRNSIQNIKLAYVLNKIMPKNHPAGVSYPSNVQKVLKKQHELSEFMRLDYESIYLFGTIMLDQWTLFVAYLLGVSKPKNYSFHKLVEQLEQKGAKGKLLDLWTQKKNQIIWLDYQVRYYRNRFIVHVDRPWQRGTTRSVYSDNFKLFIPSPPGWLDDDKANQEIRALMHLAPRYIQNAPDDYWEKARPRALLERLFSNIGEIRSKTDRRKIQALMGKVGGSTPDYKVIGLNLLKFVYEATVSVKETALKNIDKINLGKPYIRKQESVKKQG